MDNMLKSQRIKYIIGIVISFLAGIVMAVIMRKWVMLAAGALCAAYFIMELVSLYFNTKEDRYVCYVGLAVSVDQSKTPLGIMNTWRLIPVDDTGAYIDPNGNLDIFLAVDSKENHYDLHIGGMYKMLFCVQNGEGLTIDNLVRIEQQTPLKEGNGTGTAKKKPVTEKPTNKPTTEPEPELEFEPVEPLFEPEPDESPAAASALPKANVIYLKDLQTGEDR